MSKVRGDVLLSPQSSLSVPVGHNVFEEAVQLKGELEGSHDFVDNVYPPPEGTGVEPLIC